MASSQESEEGLLAITAVGTVLPLPPQELIRGAGNSGWVFKKMGKSLHGVYLIDQGPAIWQGIYILFKKVYSFHYTQLLRGYSQRRHLSW